MSLFDNKKNNTKIFPNSNKPKKNSGIESIPNGNNYYSNMNNDNNFFNRATTRKSSMNYVRKNNFSKEFNNNFGIKNNAYKFHKKIYSKEKTIKDEYHNTLRSPFRGNKNGKI